VLMMRLTFVLLVIATMVLLGLYLLYDDKKYLQYFKKLIKYSLYLAMVAAVLFLLRRIFYV
jgi:succinate dehydrogenase hydrophobic anchor subunit